MDIFNSFFSIGNCIDFTYADMELFVFWTILQVHLWICYFDGLWKSPKYTFEEPSTVLEKESFVSIPQYGCGLLLEWVDWSTASTGQLGLKPPLICLRGRSHLWCHKGMHFELGALNSI